MDGMIRTVVALTAALGLAAAVESAGDTSAPSSLSDLSVSDGKIS